MLANLVCSLIKHRRVTTTLAKAKAARSVAEKMVTLGKRGTVADRRLVASKLRHPARTLHRSRVKREAWRKHEDVVRILFEEIAPTFKERPGGYTRIVKLHQRQGDAAILAILEWVDVPYEPKKRKAKPAAKEEGKEEAPAQESGAGTAAAASGTAESGQPDAASPATEADRPDEPPGSSPEPEKK